VWPNRRKVARSGRARKHGKSSGDGDDKAHADEHLQQSDDTGMKNWQLLEPLKRGTIRGHQQHRSIFRLASSSIKTRGSSTSAAILHITRHHQEKSPK